MRLFADVGNRTTDQGYATNTQQDGQRKQFGSKERDVETGLDYFLARYYSSAQGRFISPDEFTGGPDQLFNFADAASANPTFYADLTNPQSLNKYQYTYNNPLSYTDSDGHCPECPAYWINSKIQQVDAKITQIKTDLVDYGKGLAKSAANSVIDIGNIGNVTMDDGGFLHYKYQRYEPSNEVQAMAMNSGDKLMILSIGLGTGVPVNVAMAEGKGAAVVAAKVVDAEVVATRNAHLAGGVHPKTGVPFDAKGFPDFKAAGVVKSEVSINATGTRSGDFSAANKAAGFKKTPKGYTWHHHQDGTTMQLVPRKIHAQTGHDGGFKITKK